MSTTTVKEQSKTLASDAMKVSHLLGEIFSFNSSLKLIHWSVTGKGSYSAHIALDQAIGTLLDVTDRLVETSFAYLGDLNITIPETHKPADFVAHIEEFYHTMERRRELFTETFSQSIVDDYQEGIKQLLFRLKRLE